MADIKDNENNTENSENSSENDNQDDLKNKSDEPKDLKKDLPEDSDENSSDNETDLPKEEKETSKETSSVDNPLTPFIKGESEKEQPEELSEKSQETPEELPKDTPKKRGRPKKNKLTEENNSTEEELKESIYQISLADENNLKVKVMLQRTINIDCYVRGDKTQDVHTNKITLNPDSKNPDREIEVVISLDASEAQTASKESNYKINLVNDDTLKIKVTTNKLLSIDCYYKSGEEQDSQFNKIIVNPRQDSSKQDIEIFISSEETKPKTVSLPAGTSEDEALAKGILIPNPDVADLINPETVEEKIPLTEEEKITEALTKKNPFIRQREIYRRNLTRAAVTANILFILAIFGFYAWGSQRETPMTDPNPSRIVILQDLPEAKINLENVADPNKPEEEEKPDETQDASVTIRKVTPRRINRPPIVRNTPRDTSTSRDTSDLTNELDSIRKANQLADSLKGLDSNKTAYQIPDSLKKDFTENEVGLTISALPKSWKVIDAREMNTNINQFEGVVLVDTTAGSGDVNVFVSLDRDTPDFKQEEYSDAFVMMDTTITSFKTKPRTLAGMTEYKFYLFTPTEKISVGAKIRKELFDKYKDIVEAVVRSIRIVPPKPSGEQ